MWQGLKTESTAPKASQDRAPVAVVLRELLLEMERRNLHLYLPLVI